MRRAHARLCVSCFKRFGFILPLKPKIKSSICDDNANMIWNIEAAYGRMTDYMGYLRQNLCNNTAV